MSFRFALILLLVSAAFAQKWELRQARSLGALPDTEIVEGISVRFARNAAKQLELERFLDELQRPGSKDFHRWLSPDEFADRFGLSRDEESRVAKWLLDSGFHVKHRSRTRTFITVSGDARAVKKGFSTELKRFEYKGRTHYANSTAVVLPDEVARLVAHVEGLDDFLPVPNQTLAPVPEGNIADGLHILTPDDYAVIYSFKGALGRGVDGSGQKIAIVGQSRVDLADMRLFRARYKLQPNEPELILYPGSRDPGFNEAQAEGNLDLQWAGAVARNAKLIYVYGTSALSALSYVIDQKLAPIVSVSFSAGCEAQNSASTLASTRNLAQAANAMGITWVNSSGDGGPAGCDANTSSIAQNGFSPRYPSVIPEVTAVGGTELNDRGGTYWRSSNDENGASALSYIPEIPWNQAEAGVTIASGGGGISSFFPKPAWQEGNGVGNEVFRKSPDISLAASLYNGYSVIYKGEGYIFGGTSAGTPAFAGMLALILQGTGQSALGNVNRLLYPIAQSNPESFQDITTGSTRVPCVPGSKDCAGNNFGYEAGPGFDMATGLGSIHFENLLAAWPRQQATRSLVSLSSNRNPVYATVLNGALNWTYSLTLKEHAGVATSITSLKIDDLDTTSQINAYFGSSRINAGGSITAPLVARNLTPGSTRTFVISGQDESGETWSQTLYLPFLGFAPTPVITGVANGASFQETFAPGTVVSIFGRDLAAGIQAAGAVPLINFSAGITANVDGVNAPFYYVSPAQVNVQIPYATQIGSARLTLSYPQGGSASTTINVQPAAPGIFTSGDLYTVPQARCGRGQSCILFITGQGAVSPAISTGAAPSPTASLAQLPRPVAPVTMTIGEVEASIVFAGIPYGLVGVTQINFTVAQSTPTGTQRVVVKVGSSESAGAKIDIF